MFSKSETKQLRKLAVLAYEREMARELSALGGRLDAWRAGEIDVYELHDAIHEYHDGPGGRLWSQYNRLKPYPLVASAVAREVLTAEDLPEVLRERILRIAESLASVLEPTDQDHSE